MKRIRQILFLLCMLLSVQQAGALLIENPPLDPNWIGNIDTSSPEGTDYWAAFMTHNGLLKNDPNLKLSIYAIADSPTTIIIEVNGTVRGRIPLTADASGYVAEGVNRLTTTLVYLAATDVEKAMNCGVHIYSEDRKTPFSCYAFSEAGQGLQTTRASALLLPTHMLGTQYYVQTYQTDANATEFAVVATENNTHITISSPIATSKTAKPDDGPVVFNQTLKKGQVFMVRSNPRDISIDGQDINLSGSFVCADRPVAVFQGNDYVKIVTEGTSAGTFSGNHVFNQTFPIEQLGNEYYIGLTEHAKYNFYNILATVDGTVVNVSGKAPLTMNAGDKIPSAYLLSATGDKFTKVTSNQPIMVTSYLSCGGINGETTETGAMYFWGNQTGATMTSWERRVKKKSFYTQDIPNEMGSGISHMYVQVIANSAQVGTFTLDGVPVPASSFVRMNPAAPAMSVANIELTSAGKHTLETTGDGFVGFVYAISSDSRAYQYTLGLTPKPLYDSLFVAETSNIMSASSYNLERTSKGWYQRQLDEWKKGKERLDTAIVCDSTLVHWAVETPRENPVEQIDWTIYNVTDGKKVGENADVIETNTVTPRATVTRHPYQYKFMLPEEPENKRHAFFEYEVHAVLHRTLEKCETEVIDTFKTVVRVTRMYNDTTWMVVCKGDVFDYFSDVTTSGERYSTKFYFNSTPDIDVLPQYRKYQYQSGSNTVQRAYTSHGGCDSIRTLRFYVCETKNEELDTTICEDGLEDFRAKIGAYYFNNIDFAESFKARDRRWKRQTDGSYVFEGSSSIKTKSCKDEAEEYIRHGAQYNGCDSTLTLRLRVMPVEIRSKSINMCGGSYEWKDDDGNVLDIITKKAGENYNTPKTYTKGIPYNICTNCPAERCDSVRYELTLMFVDDDASATIHLCQNAAPYTYTHKDDITQKEHSWTFDPRGKRVGEYSYEDDKYLFTGGGCDYYFHPVFVVDTVITYRDSVVYCYPGDIVVTHEWEGHRNFYYYEKGKSQRHGPSLSVSVNYANNGIVRRGQRLIYELTDTIWAAGECPTVYNQVVIFMPNYKVTSPTVHMSDEDVYEWDDRLLAGDKATDYENPKGLEVIVMKPTGGSYPAEWTVTYKEKTKEYTITNRTQTKAIHDKDGNEQRCDSTNTLKLRIGQKFDSTAYRYTCSAALTYEEWRDTVIELPQDLTEPTTLLFYDSMKTTSPVKDLDSVYILSLTVYPSFIDTTDLVNDCQSMDGYQWEGHKGEGHELYINGVKMDPSWDSIPIAETGHYYITDIMQTEPRTFTDPGTGETVQVRCDSIWVLDLMIHEVYDSTFTYIVGDTVVVKSNDTITHFTPKTLFIGKDFDYEAHGGKTAEELAAEAGADKWEILTRDSMFSKTAPSRYGCDSTTYEYIKICWLQQKHFNVIIGDNDTTWTFGGDTTPDEYGVREHTQPLVSGNDFHVDDYGNAIDYTSKGRTVRTREYVDTLHTIDGCDSIVHMSLKIYPSYRFDTTAATCHNQPFEWRGKKDLHLLGTDSVTSVVYVEAKYYTKESGRRVDSVYVLKLTIIPGISDYSHKSMCYNDTFQFFSKYIYYIPGIERDSIVVTFKEEGAACGDQYVLYPTFFPAYGYKEDPNYKAFVDSADICQYDDFHWIDKKTGREHIQNLRDADGNKYTKIPTDRKGWHTIYDSLKTVSCNCDSIYTLHYYVDTTYRYLTDTAICPGDEFRWVVKDKYGRDYTNGKIYSSDITSHIYDTIHGKTVHGCDSSYYLHIFVDQPYEIHIDTTLCYENGHFEWTGDKGLINYDEYIQYSHHTTEPQEFFDTLHAETARGKCDSTLYLHLIIAPSADSVWTDTICVGEKYMFYDRELTTGGKYDIHHPNEWGCDVRYELTLIAINPTTFEVSSEPVCINDISTDVSYTLHYIYQGEFQPVSYSVRYDSLAQVIGFVDQEQIAISEKQTAGNDYELYIPLPEMTRKEDYPRPDFYTARIAFENGVCEGDSLMTYPFQFTINYPNWIMEQRHGDVIALLDSAYNGGYRWTTYQWYEGDEKLVGQTRPYLHIPTGLTPGALYHVELTRVGDSIAFPACEIAAIENPIINDYAPTLGYLSVTPTCIVVGHPFAYILSRKDGMYRIATAEGKLVSEDTFRADVTEVQLPAVSGMYIFQLWSPDTPEEPYRAIKVLVRDQCPNCDISSF